MFRSTVRTRRGPLPEPARFRWITASVACVLLWPSVADVAHRLSVEHAICPEHGETIHVGNHAELDPATHSAPVGPDGSVGQGGNGSHDHEHCALVGASGERVGLAGISGTAVRVIQSLPEQLIDPAAWAPRSISLRWLAPKQSPPLQDFV